MYQHNQCVSDLAMRIVLDTQEYKIQTRIVSLSDLLLLRKTFGYFCRSTELEIHSMLSSSRYHQHEGSSNVMNHK